MFAYFAAILYYYRLLTFVCRRDTIVTRGEAQMKAKDYNKKVVTKGTFQRQMGELRKKIKTTIKVQNTIYHKN